MRRTAATRRHDQPLWTPITMAAGTTESLPPKTQRKGMQLFASQKDQKAEKWGRMTEGKKQILAALQAVL